MAVEIYIARHGQNQDNANGLLNGHRDLPLTDIGREQARELGEGIIKAELQFDAVYSSPLSRAFETAQIVCKIADLKMEPIILPELIERDFGVMTGKPKEHVDHLDGVETLKTDTVTYFLDPEGAETFPILLARGHKVLGKVRELQPDGKALLVAHGDIGKMVYAAATGTPWKDVLTNFHFGNCELIDVSQNDEAHVIKLEQHNH